MHDKCHSFWLTEAKDLHAIFKDLPKLSNTQDHPLFFTPEWFEATLSWQPKSAKPVFWVAKLNKQIIGLMPLCLIRHKYKGLAYTSLEWLKVPDTQFCDLLAEPHLKQELLQYFFKDLSEAKIHWDILELYPINKTFIGQQLSIPFKSSKLIASQHYWVDLSQGWDSYYQSRSRRLKKGNNHLANKLQSQGKIEIEQITNQNHYQLDELMQILTYLSQGSWKVHTKTTFDHQGPQNFIRCLTQSALNQNTLSIWLLKLNKAPIAFEYQLIHGDQVYALRSDFNEKFRDFSPGSYLNWQILKKCAELGVKKYYMGPGSNPYKLRWQNQSIDLYRLTAYAKTFKAKVIYNFREMVTMIKSKSKVESSIKEQQA